LASGWNDPEIGMVLKLVLKQAGVVVTLLPSGQATEMELVPFPQGKRYARAQGSPRHNDSETQHDDQYAP